MKSEKFFPVAIFLHCVSISWQQRYSPAFRKRSSEHLPHLHPYERITRRLAACTQAVVILRSTSYIATIKQLVKRTRASSHVSCAIEAIKLLLLLTELNVLHLKSYEIQSNRYMCAIVPLIAYLRIDL